MRLLQNHPSLAGNQNLFSTLSRFSLNLKKKIKDDYQQNDQYNPAMIRFCTRVLSPNQAH